MIVEIIEEMDWKAVSLMTWCVVERGLSISMNVRVLGSVEDGTRTKIEKS
jgi:hypothetical protein